MNNLFYFITDCKPFFFFLRPIFILNILLLKCVDQAQILQQLGGKKIGLLRLWSAESDLQRTWDCSHLQHSFVSGVGSCQHGGEAGSTVMGTHHQMSETKSEKGKEKKVVWLDVKKTKHTESFQAQVWLEKQSHSVWTACTCAGHLMVCVLGKNHCVLHSDLNPCPILEFSLPYKLTAISVVD